MVFNADTASMMNKATRLGELRQPPSSPRIVGVVTIIFSKSPTMNSKTLMKTAACAMMPSIFHMGLFEFEGYLHT